MGRLLQIFFAFSLLLGLIRSAPATAASIVADVDYTRDGGSDHQVESAVQSSLLFFLSRLPHGRPQTISEYMRTCGRLDRPNVLNESCSRPDFLIQLEIVERQGEVEISGSVQRKEGKSSRLDLVRVKPRDLPDGLSHAVRDIDAILTAAGPRPERTPVLLACFRSVSSLSGPGTELGDRLPNALEAAMRNHTGISVSILKDASADCGSTQGLHAISQAAKVEAIVGSGIEVDSQGGITIRPYIFIGAVSERVDLPPFSLGRDAALASYVPDLRKLGAATAALVGSSKHRELVKAIGERSELALYLARARGFLSSAPLDYEAADALLGLAIWKEPSDPQAYLALAASLADRRLYQRAAGVLQSGIDKVSGGKAGLSVALAENAVRERDLPKARRVYERAYSEKILGEEALLGIARTYLTARPPDRGRAMEYAVNAMARYPSSVDAYALAGQVALSDNDFVKAEDYLQRGRSVSPTSPEIMSRLSSLYERMVTNEQRKGNSKAVVEYLTKSIDLWPSLKKYYDRGREYFSLYANSAERIKGYQLSVADYKAALDMTKEEGVFAQFPWLLPNLIESLIFDGKFQEAKKLSEDLFKALGTESSLRAPTDPRELRIIGAFLNFAAELLDKGSAEKEVYLLENAKLGRGPDRSPWGFSDMLTFLADDYPKIRPELDAAVREDRVAAVRKWVGLLTEK